MKPNKWIQYVGDYKSPYQKILGTHEIPTDNLSGNAVNIFTIVFFNIISVFIKKNLILSWSVFAKINHWYLPLIFYWNL